MGFNIKTRAVADVAAIELTDADGAELLNDAGQRCIVNVYGPGSKKYAQASAARQQRMIAKMAGKGAARARINAEEQAEESATFLADVTHSIQHFDYEGASDHAAIKAMYLDSEIGFIADQVQAKVGDWANFLKKPSSNALATSSSSDGSTPA